MYFKNKELYMEYLEENKVENYEELLSSSGKYFSWTDNGELILESIVDKKSTLDVTTYSACIGWVILDDGKTMALIKNVFGDIYRSLDEKNYQVSLYNNVLLPQIAKQLENKCAKYYIAKKSNNDVRRYILTLDFRNQNQLIHGRDILEKIGYNPDELRYQTILYALEDYLIEYGYKKEDIEKIKKDFIKQSLFGLITEQIDEHNENWGILVNDDKTAEIAPLYDIDCSSGIKKAKTHRRICENGTHNIYDFIKQFSDENWLSDYLKDILNAMDIDEAFEETKENTNIEIPVEIKEYYREFFKQKKNELKNAYEKVYRQEEKDKEEDNLER